MRMNGMCENGSFEYSGPWSRDLPPPSCVHGPGNLRAANSKRVHPLFHVSLASFPNFRIFWGEH